MKNDKQIIRRTLAFAAALSFTYFSCSSDLNSVISGAETATTSESKSESSKPQTASETPAVTSLKPETSKVPDSTATSEVTAVTTVSTEATTTVTTTDPENLKSTLTIKFNEKVNDNTAREVIRKLFNKNDSYLKTEEKNGEYTVKYLFTNTVPNLDKVIDERSNKNEIYTDRSENYIFVNGDSNDHVFKIIKNSDSSLTLSLCYLVTLPQSGFNYEEKSKVLQHDIFNVSGLIHHGNWWYAEKNSSITITGKDGWYYNNSNSHVQNFDINDNGNDDSPNYYLSMDVTNENNNVAVVINKNIHKNNNTDSKQLIKASFTEAEIQLQKNDQSGKNVNVKLNSKDFDSHLKWSDAKSLTISFDHANDIDYDIIVKKNNNNITQLNSSSFTDKSKAELDFSNETLSEVLYQKDVSIEINIRPAKVSVPAHLNDPSNVVTLPIEINGIGSVPNIYIKNNITYYLDTIEYGAGEKPYEIHIADKIIKGGTIDRYTKLDFESIKRISCVKYIKINSAQSAEGINIYGTVRNNNCRTIKADKTSVKFIELNLSDIISTSTDTDTSPFKYFVLYRTKNSDKITSYGFTNKFELLQTSITSGCVEIISVLQNVSKDNSLSSENLVEIPLEKQDKLFYIDNVAPVIAPETIKIEKGDVTATTDNSKEIWFNSECTLMFNTNDNAVEVNDDAYRPLINTLSDNGAEIASVSIGRNTENIKTTDDKYIFTNSFKPNTTYPQDIKIKNWSVDKPDKTYIPYTISNFYAEKTQNNDFIFYATINPKDQFIDEDVSITVTDLAGKTVTEQIHLKIDTKAPDITSFNIPELIKGSSASNVEYINNAQNKKDKISLSANVNDNDIYQLYSETKKENIKQSAEDPDAAPVITYTYTYQPVDTETKGSGLKNIKIEFIPDNASDNSVSIYNGTTPPSDYKFTIPESMKDKSGKILLTASDNAGNETLAYYPYINQKDADKDSLKYDKIIFDYTDPKCDITDINDTECYSDGHGRKWVNAFPKNISVKADDKAPSPEKTSAGLKSLNITLNGNLHTINIAGSSIDPDALANGKYKLSFSKNNTTGDLTLSLADDEGNTIKLFDETADQLFTNIPANEKNIKYNIKLSATDYSGNKSSEKEITFYMDTVAPSAKGDFSLTKDNTSVSPLKFGSFSDKTGTLYADVTDTGISGSSLTSGLAEAVIEYNGNEYKNSGAPVGKDNNIYTFKFENLPKDFTENSAIESNAKITITDNAGNKSSAYTLKNTEGSSVLVFENIKPVIEISTDTEAYNEKPDGSGRKWYSKDMDVSIAVTDNMSGISTIESSLKNTDYNKDITINNGNSKQTFSGESEAKLSHDFILNTASEDLDGEFIFEIKANDNAGNAADTKTVTVYKDITSPVIDGFDFSDAGSGEDTENQTGPQIPYYHFSNSTERRVVRVKVTDPNISSELSKIELKLTDNNGNESYAAPAGNIFRDPENPDTYKNLKFYQDFIIPANFKGTLSAMATDNVGNNLGKWWTPKGYINETPDKHNSETDPVTISLPDTEYRDAKGNRLYNHDIDAVIKVKDNVSGIREITVNYPENQKTLHTNLDQNGIDSEWTIETSDINLPTQISTVIGQNSNKNYNEISLTAYDYTNNEIKTPEPVVFSIDKTKPQISVTFDNTTPDSTYNNYYKAGRTATVKIKERNFNPDKVELSHPVSGNWTLVSGPETEGTDNAVYQNTVTFSTDGTYQLKVNCSDICDNPAEQAYDSGEFIIDLTAPKINVSFDNNNSLNNNYYNAKRTAVIEIEELNFDPARVSITGTRNGSSEEFPVKNGKVSGNEIGWSNVSGNTWKANIPVNDDGFYKFNVAATDKAGNSSETYHTEFNIDTATPEISFSGIKDQQAYNGEVKPVIEITDSNIDFSTVEISMKGSKNKNSVKLEGTVEQTDGKYKFTASDIPHTAENDDIYTITAEAKDLAGNPASSDIKISVNRFGSTFEPDEKSASLNGNTVKESGDVFINEINTDKHPDSFKPTVRVVRNGSNNVLEETKDYTVELSTDSTTGWYKYVYKIKSDVFADDGVYEIMIYSEDKATNKNYSDSIMKFSIDKTKPSVNYLTIEEGGIYKTDSKLVTALLNDNLEIDPDSISVLINGNELKKSDFEYNAQSSEISFSIPNSNSTQYVEIMACDMAGNELDPVQAKIDNLFVSTSSARILLHKTWFKIAAVSAGIAALGTGAFLFLRKRKKG